MSDSINRLGLLAGLCKPFVAFANQQWSSGVLLMVCAGIALIAANSPLAEAWNAFWHIPISVSWGSATLSHSLGHWINDGLMVIFFLLVGLEIKREMISGELSGMHKAMLPIGAAVGGMLFPASIYLACTWNGQAVHGWGIPTATDIAFALGVMRLVGKRIPAALFVFLTALAIADDLGAVLVIALFYTSQLNVNALLLAGALLAGLIALNRLRVTATLPYAVLGLLLWAATLASGIHATIAGVALAITIPLRSGDAEHSPLHHWEHAIHPWSSYVILPLFALANAGVALAGNLGHAVATDEFWGIVLALVIGKPLGITVMAWLLVRCGWARLPDGVRWSQLAAVSCLAGIGFTMSLFIAMLAFTQAELIDTAKLGIIFGSTVAAIIGALACWWTAPRGAPERVPERAHETAT